MNGYSIQDLENDLAAILHGTTINQITNFYGLVNRAARTLLIDVDPQETKRTLEFVAPIFNSVFDYPLAPDVKGNKLIDIRPQVRRLPIDLWTQQYNQAFDIAKQNIYSRTNMFTMNFDTGIKTIRINAPFLNPPIIVNEAEGIILNGTWTTTGTASSITTNNVNFVQGSGSLAFNVTSGAASVVNSTMSATNLQYQQNQSSFFVNVYVPNASLLTSVTLLVGSDVSDYYSFTTTQTQQGTAFQNGWNLCQFQWNYPTTVGTPNVTALDFVQVTLNVTGSMTGCLVNGINCIMGSIMEYEYYSKYMFRDAITGAFQEKVTSSTNLINLDTESYNLLFNLVAFLAAQQTQGLDALFYDGNFFGQQYQEGLARYKSLYKSELQKPQTIYYAQPQKGYNRYNSRWFGN